MDTYVVSVTKNSTSTMHKLASTPITLDCFEMDDDISSPFVEDVLIPYLEELRQKYNRAKEEKVWKELIKLLPSAWLQMRTWTANYAVLRNIIKWRAKHRLPEWHTFVDWCRTLPYAKDLLFYDNKPGVNG